MITLGYYAHHISGEKRERYYLVGLLALWYPIGAIIGYFVVMGIRYQRRKTYEDAVKLHQSLKIGV